MWRLLLIAGLGNVAAVLLVCVVPLFTQVALSAGIRTVLNGPGDATHIIVNGFSNAPTPQAVADTQQQLSQIIAHDMGPYALSGAPQFSVIVQDLGIASDASANPGPNGPGTLQLTGMDMTQAAQQYPIISGRLPAASSATLEVALDEANATALGVKVGDTIQAQLPSPPQQQQGAPPTLSLRVVGLYTQPSLDAFSNQTTRFAQNFGPGSQYTALASNQSILAALATVDAKNGITTTSQFNGPPPLVVWSYPLDSSRISANSLNDVIDRLNAVQRDVGGQLGNGPNFQGLFLDSGAYQALSTFRIQILVLQIPLLLLLLQVIALILLFVRMMADMLVDRQAEAIATLRSRGATRRQIFNMFTLHNLGLSLIALVVGPLAAIPIARALAERALPAASQNALAALSGNPLDIAWGLRWYVLVAVVVSGFAMIFTTNRAASNNILTLRRENARTTTKPFWQRLNLDLIFGAIAVVGYVAYSIAVREVSATIQLILSPVALIASLLMLIAAAFLFLRVLPPLLALGSRLANRGRGATSMLALTQMARAPKQPIRMTLLLALATAFTLFTLVYSASQAQRLVDVASYHAGADFSGSLPSMSGSAVQPSAAALTTQYAAIPGVTAASIGYAAHLDPGPGAGSFPIQLTVVDAATFAQSARWSATESDQSLSSLMAQLDAARSNGIANDTVPAIVDDTTWQALQLSPGAAFSLLPPGFGRRSMGFIAVGHVAHLPGVYGSYQGQGVDGDGGVLADYASYAAVYHHDLTTPILNATLAPNYVWLATRGDDASLASVRKALGSGTLALGGLLDARQITEDERNNPLQIEFANTLLIGAAIALLLALIGIWVGSWLNARGRLVNFAVLRALGTTPRQIRGMLIWEQAIVYLAGGALGILLGWVLALTALPMLIFVELATSGNFTRTPNVPPAQVVIPGATLGLALAALVVICALALILTMAALARLSLGQTLRLNED
jgi:ABC-type lipoprotein release transport system permease subunit